MNKRSDKGANVDTIEELKNHLQFNLELLLKADASYELYHSLLSLHLNDKSKQFRHLPVIMIDALVTNCVIMTTRLIDSREKINICNTIKRASALFPEDVKLSSFQTTLERENVSVDRLCARRDKFYAHSDLENLDDENATNYPLLGEDLHIVIGICFDAINAAYSSINGCVIGGYDVNTKKRYIHNTKLVLAEIEKLMNIFSLHDKMIEFMSEHNKQDLCSLIYSDVEVNK